MARLSYSVRRCEAVFSHIEDEHSDDKVGSRRPRQLLLLQPATTDVKTSQWKVSGPHLSLASINFKREPASTVGRRRLEISSQSKVLRRNNVLLEE